MDIDFKAIGKRIRIARIQADLTQEKLAAILDISVPHMSNIERGMTKVSLSRIISIANALSLDGIDQFVCEHVSMHRVTYNTEIQSILDDCDSYEIRHLVEQLQMQKDSMRDLKEHYQTEQK